MNKTKAARIPRGERGAAAVEFALVLPLLVALVLGIVDFGRAYNQQVSKTFTFTAPRLVGAALPLTLKGKATMPCLG